MHIIYAMRIMRNLTKKKRKNTSLVVFRYLFAIYHVVYLFKFCHKIRGSLSICIYTLKDL